MKAFLMHQRNRDNVIIVVMSVIALSALTAWLLSHGFMFDGASHRWAKVLGVLGSEDVRLENLSMLYPHLPLYALVPFYYLPGTGYGAVPYFVSVLFAGGLIGLFLWHMRHLDVVAYKRLLIVFLLVVHPAFLWGATNGSQLAMSMLMFYLLYHACQNMIAEHDVHAYISLSIILAVFFFVDGSAVFLFVALLPMLAVVAPRRLLMASPASIYFILSVPFFFSVLAWAWLNWIFESDFLYFVQDPESTYLGGYMEMFKYPWLVDFGGEFFQALIAATGYMLVAYPIIIYFLFSTWDEGLRFRASFVLFVHPLLAIALATDQYYLSHPMEILVLINASILAEITFLDMARKRVYWSVISFLVVSLVGGWWIFMESADPNMNRWVDSFRTERVMIADEDGSLKLGRWLNENRRVTLIDERSGYKAMVARGDAEGLYLSFTSKFKIALNHEFPDVDQIVVPDPDSETGKKDKISQRYPLLYKEGMKGYRLVYKDNIWRVYRKV
ncbi:hypothetical protein Ga0123462_0586 [Mariprofundus ferrinatatus]|uniref:Dolichyl-phosphate-mannose-protein mannosyltransferase n=1 Tax=Mariprofundus ferrinatatus TaxID=1921087 RepID=A0A2K8LB29_9PROT|nr:hypothetical protein [Mariprofundus ferrinatatus]ATX81456.1 hypothetical protein Ga0123462_0586 [Mariprofundus ferrinatatus]